MKYEPTMTLLSLKDVIVGFVLQISALFYTKKS